MKGLCCAAPRWCMALRSKMVIIGWNLSSFEFRVQLMNFQEKFVAGCYKIKWHSVVSAALYLRSFKKHGVHLILPTTDCRSGNVEMAWSQWYLTRNTSSYRYGTSHINQRIENWLSHFRLPFSYWAIDHFKE